MNILSLIESKLVDVEASVLRPEVYNYSVIYLNPFTYLHFRKCPEKISSVQGIRIDGILMRLLVSLFVLRGRDQALKRQSFDMTSLAPKVFKFCQDQNRSIYIAGGSNVDIEVFIRKIKDLFPRLSVIGSCDGYSADEEIIDKIVSCNPDVVLLGLGNLKQERVLIELNHQISSIKFTCGAFISQTANTDGVHYYPTFIDKYNLRWLYRVLTDAKIFKRVIRYYPTFLCFFLVDLIVFRNRK